MHLFLSCSVTEKSLSCFVLHSPVALHSWAFLLPFSRQAGGNTTLISVKWCCQIVCRHLLNYPEEQPGLQKLTHTRKNLLPKLPKSRRMYHVPAASTVHELQLAWECLPLIVVLTRFLLKSSTLCSHLDDLEEISMHTDAKDIPRELSP